MEANAVSSIAFLNDGMAYVYYNMMRYAVDQAVYETLQKFSADGAPDEVVWGRSEDFVKVAPLTDPGGPFASVDASLELCGVLGLDVLDVFAAVVFDAGEGQLELLLVAPSPRAGERVLSVARSDRGHLTTQVFLADTLGGGRTFEVAVDTGAMVTKLAVPPGEEAPGEPLGEDVSYGLDRVERRISLWLTDRLQVGGRPLRGGGSGSTMATRGSAWRACSARTSSRATR